MRHRVFITINARCVGVRNWRGPILETFGIAARATRSGN
jgi:hypothetical protein